MRRERWVLALVAASLGYCVDVYDMVLFTVLRPSSLQDLGVPPEASLRVGAFLLNVQLVGMLVGGIVWGVLGDKRGRRSVLFGSIVLYSLGTLANGLVQDIPTYAVVRFFTGVGLAGELGAGVTLVSELMKRESRGWGSALIATAGVIGTTAGVAVSSQLTWRTAYIVGGFLGLALLGFRMGTFESSLFEALKGRSGVARGALVRLLRRRQSAKKYIGLVLVGLPLWYVAGILVMFVPEIGSALGAKEPPDVGIYILCSNAGLAAGDLGSGLISQLMRSRKRVLGLFLVVTTLAVGAYYFVGPMFSGGFYWIAVATGFASGYMAVLFVTASEHFGTNVRATVSTTVPNFVRAGAVPLLLAFDFAKGPLGVAGSGIAVGVVTFVLAFLGLTWLEETFGKDLDYVEELA